MQTPTASKKTAITNTLVDPKSSCKKAAQTKTATNKAARDKTGPLAKAIAKGSTAKGNLKLNQTLQPNESAPFNASILKPDIPKLALNVSQTPSQIATPIKKGKKSKAKAAAKQKEEPRASPQKCLTPARFEPYHEDPAHIQMPIESSPSAHEIVSELDPSYLVA